MHHEAYENMEKAAKKMKDRVAIIDGKLGVGDVVQLGLHVVDQTKVDGKNITGVVVWLLNVGRIAWLVRMVS